MSDNNHPVDPTPSSSGDPAGTPVKPRQLRVRKSVADMMSSAKPRSRGPWGTIFVLLLLAAGGWAAWNWREAWLPAARELAASKRPAPAATASPAAAEPSEPADVDDAGEEEDSAEFAPPRAAQPEPPPPPAAPAAPAAASRPRAPAAPSPASLFNEAYRDYQVFLSDKQANAGMLPDIIERAYRAAKGFEAMLDLADDEKKAQINEAMSQCYRLISDCRRQNTEAARSLQGASQSTHAPFNRATVGPKRQPPLRPPEPAPAPAP